jgi:predicted alpha-1,2-mannosidase
MNASRWFALALGCSSLVSCSKDAGPAPSADPITLADPRMGSGGYSYAYGAAFAGASGPSGMLRVGADTTGPLGNLPFQHFSGYWSGDDHVLAFSHLHLHGTGASDYGVFALMPGLNFNPLKLRAEDLSSGFDKSTEVATPGYYGLTLANGIDCEFAANGHSARERFTFPTAQASGTIQLDLAHKLTGSITASQLTLDASAQTAAGTLTTSGGMSGGFTLYYVVQFLQPWSAQHVFSEGNAPSNGSTASGTKVGAALDFALTGKPVELRVGLSLVSLEGAKANLATELAGATFNDDRATAENAWVNRLNVARVFGGTVAQQAAFYSALHHAFVMPGVYSDSDGSYRYRGSVQHAAGFSFVTDLSLWDTYRTLNPLYHLLAPELGNNVSASLFEMAKIDGAFPKWTLATSDAGSMIGASAEVVLSDAYLKSVRGFDAEGAYQLMRAAALNPDPSTKRGGRSDSQEYLTLGYVPADLHDSSVALTTEYATDDTALANFAEALGHPDDAAALRARALGYRKLFDPQTLLLRARDRSGALTVHANEPFNSTSWTDYREGDAQQYTWVLLHDPAGLSALFGGLAQTLAALDHFFASSVAEHSAALAAAGKDDGIDQLAQARNLPQGFYWAGNENGLNVPLQYAVLGRPEGTAQWTAWARDNFFSHLPNGLPGNDDGGTMSAWYLFSALGIFPIPGSDRYVIASPLFPRVELKVGGGTFAIVADGVSEKNLYVQSAELNGAALNSGFITHADLRAGGSLVLHMGPVASGWAHVTN